MKKIIILLLLIVPCIALSQYITPTMYPKSTTSGNGDYYMAGDTVISSWITVNPGYYTIGIQYADSCFGTMEVYERFNLVVPTVDDFWTQVDNLDYLDQQIVMSGTQAGNAKMFNVFVSGSQIRFIVRFTTYPATRIFKYKVFFGRQPYLYNP